MKTTSLTETKNLAKQFLSEILSNKKSDVGATTTKNSATIVGLHGNLGSGKTTFTQAIAAELNITEQVTSPTFVVQKKYVIQDESFRAAGFTHFIHIDAYRLEEASELEVIGWSSISADSHNLIFIEWPERVSQLLPQDMYTINFTFIDESVREIVW
jgi:tRNA threonylcarbamoyladenosine biosynthesis protein TsaE